MFIHCNTTFLIFHTLTPCSSLKYVKIRDHLGPSNCATCVL